ncbi:copper-binding protein NosD [Paenibacillus taihuensis]|uniref:Copper-binding protein NosD n=1 Tax=Paenibacillus taihuensis TaxID=1156355 RepID=A0A3D9SD89_9BACL|nr:right-handed parallel beta-helix repeat-containing protein [Paenibacillus taihuensis]REE92839.1 copper-binding protein NosD [Paenibacillus taihuensis]
MELYVSCVSGNDGDHGAAASNAVRTIGRAQELVRAKLAEGYAESITVWIGGGVYELSAPLRFDGRDGFAEAVERSVTYRSVPGEEVCIAGGKMVDGASWEPYHGGNYRVRLEGSGADTGVAAVQTLYENGVRAVKARWPKVGYNAAAGKAERDDRRGFKFGEGDLPDFALDAGAQIHIWPGEGEWIWFTETKTIGEIDRDAKEISFAEPAPWGIDRGSRYRIQGALQLLTEPGEFYCDEAEGMLYYYPRQLPIAEQSIVVPTVRRVIELCGESVERPVSGIRLEGLTIAYSDCAQQYRMPSENCEQKESRDGLIYMENAVGNAVRGCRIQQSGFSGVVLNGYCQHNTIADNLIEHLGYNGVYVLGFAPGEGDFASAAEADVSKFNLITNNLIRYGGELIGHGSGLQLYQSGSNEVSNNEIHGMPRYGISLKGLRYGAMEESYYGTKVTLDNHYDFTHTRNNVITRNNVWDVMKDSQDGGMIESWGPGVGNQITYNRFHHSGIYFSFGFCIYLDDASDHYVVSHNVVHDLFSAGSGTLWFVIFSKGIGNRIENNLLVRNGANAAFGTQEMAGEANRDITFVRNIAYESGEQLYHFVNFDDRRLQEADYNLFCNGESLPTVTGIYNDDKRGHRPIPWEEWRAQLDGRYDSHTLQADPLLSFEKDSDGALQIELRPESPAFGLGWEPIDMSRIGLTASFPWARE